LSNNYNTNPYSFVQDSLILRVNATLWGPSQLGSYLIVPISIAFWQRLRTKNLGWSLALGIMTVGLFASQSRAAWVAAALSLGLVWAYHYKHLISRQRALLALSGIIIIAALTLGISYKTDSALSRLVFHASSGNAISQSSNSDRFEAINEGLDQFQSKPLGGGVGSAGPASSYAAKTLYTESFYIQLLVELGFVGLLTFLAISLIVLRRIYIGMASKPLLLPLLASGIGLVLMNAVHHTWTDAPTAIIWWGLTGLILASRQA
jgi:O-antigen ligase